MSTAIYTKGSLTIDGIKLSNEKTNAAMRNAPIYADGRNAYIHFISGEISNTQYLAGRGFGSHYSSLYLIVALLLKKYKK